MLTHAGLAPMAAPLASLFQSAAPEKKRVAFSAILSVSPDTLVLVQCAGHNAPLASETTERSAVNQKHTAEEPVERRVSAKREVLPAKRTVFSGIPSAKKDSTMLDAAFARPIASMECTTWECPAEKSHMDGPPANL